MSRFYDRDGKPMTLEQWSTTFEAASDSKKKGNGRHVGYTDENKHLVSTVWLGIDHRYGDGPPLIFETMIFCHHEPECTLNEEQWRYSTEEEAIAGHNEACRMVEKWTAA